jgi:hypothetical protein
MIEEREAVAARIKTGFAQAERGELIEGVPRLRCCGNGAPRS